jgi:hypothetical protein
MPDPTPTPSPEPTPTPTPAPDPTPTPTPAPEATWRDSITDAELKKVAERFTSPADAVKAVADLRKRESTSIRIPGKDAKPEEIAAYRKALDVPEAAKDYQFERPAHIDEALFATDDMKAVLGKYAEAFHAAGLSKGQVKQVLDAHWAMDAEAKKALVDADKAFATESETQLRKEWPGQEYDRNKAAANRAVSQFFGTTLEDARKLETKDGRFLLDHPIILKAFAQIGREMGEDRLGPMLSDSEKQSAQDKIGQLQTEKMAALNRGDRTTAARLDAEQRKLIEKTQGTGSIVGSQGRAA